MIGRQFHYHRPYTCSTSSPLHLHLHKFHTIPPISSILRISPLCSLSPPYKPFSKTCAPSTPSVMFRLILTFIFLLSPFHGIFHSCTLIFPHFPFFFLSFLSISPISTFFPTLSLFHLTHSSFLSQSFLVHFFRSPILM